MRFEEVMKPSNIDISGKVFANKEDAFQHMAAMLKQSGSIADTEAFLDALHHRETLGSTYMGDSLAVPHGKSETVTQISAALCRCAPFEYESCGESGEVSLIIMLAISVTTEEKEYLRTLSNLSRMLMHSEFRNVMEHSDDPMEIIAAGNSVLDSLDRQ